MNLANVLTCSRAGLAAVFIFFIFSTTPFGKFLALFFFIAGALTDYWDGVLARGLGEVSQFGKLMDPIADKVLTLSAFFSFWILGLLPLWMVLVVVGRDLLVTGARFFASLRREGHEVRGSGKKKTVIQILFIIAVLLYLIARQSAEWQPSWNETAIKLTNGGMLVIVLFTVWTGARALFKKS